MGGASKLCSSYNTVVSAAVEVSIGSTRGAPLPGLKPSRGRVRLRHVWVSDMSKRLPGKEAGWTPSWAPALSSCGG